MGKFAICAGAIALAIATVPASAEQNVGPMRNGNQCWQASGGLHANAGFGYWGTCPSSIGAAHNAMGTGSELRRPLRPRRDPHNDR